MLAADRHNYTTDEVTADMWTIIGFVNEITETQEQVVIGDDTEADWRHDAKTLETERQHVSSDDRLSSKFSLHDAGSSASTCYEARSERFL